jgi:Holliday junction resolvasome RuvABC endonuclease subunit
MKKIPIQKIEKAIGKNLKRNCTAIGFDVAKNHTGIAVITTLKASLILGERHTIDNQKSKDQLESMEYYLGELNNFISRVQMKGHKIFIIEDCFFGFNVNTLKVLARCSILTWRELKHISDSIYLILAKSARSKIGFVKDTKRKSSAKAQVQEYINKLFGIEEADDNKTDALALALQGLLDE